MAAFLLPALTMGASALLASRNNKKKGGGGFTFMPYEGNKPPHIDEGGKEYLRPTQDLTQSTIMDRSQGIGVGYDPARRAAQEALIRSSLERQQEEQIRDAQGRLSSSGLSGNARAQEALAGRVKKDVGRSLADQLGAISIEDLTRANEERDVNTARLQRLNETNFGQENTRANFDLNVYNAEQGNRMGASQDSLNRQQMSNEGTSDLLNAGIGAASIFMGGGSSLGGLGQAAGALAGGSSKGQGIAPLSGAMNYFAPPGTMSQNALKRRITQL